MEKISILLVEDHTIIREGMRAILQAEPDFAVVAEAADGGEAVELAAALEPDVVVMDIALPVKDGVQATREILAACSSTRVLVVSSYSDPESIDAALKAGAKGYLVKATAADELPKAIRDTRRGQPSFSPTVSAFLQKQSQGKAEAPQRFTRREGQVLQLIAEGYANKEIAVRLKLSPKTVEKHRQSVMNRLNIHERAGLTRFAIAQGLVPAKPEAGQPVNFLP